MYSFVRVHARRAVSLLSAALLLLSLAGCSSSSATPAERAQSFKPLAGLVVDDLPIQDFVAQRTAHLISIDELNTAADTEGHDHVTKIRILGACTAVAITH